nr:MAG: hypothetical protein [Lokiarchaeota virus Skoll Meg22_1214]
MSKRRKKTEDGIKYYEEEYYCRWCGERNLVHLGLPITNTQCYYCGKPYLIISNIHVLKIKRVPNDKKMDYFNK